MMKPLWIAALAVLVCMPADSFAQAQAQTQAEAETPAQEIASEALTDAQPAAPQEASEAGEMPPQAAITEEPQSLVFNRDDYGSIVFTHWEYIAIQDNIKVRDSGGAVRPTTDYEVKKAFDENANLEERPKPPPEQRELRLAGIVYDGPKNWTIWLNEKRYTPEALPKEALDLTVHKNYIEVKWYDEWSNKIYPIRLRQNQRFNIDTRIFLPGS